MLKYRITVIIPVHDVREYIEDCLNSIVSQTIDKNELEVLLIIDGANDSSEGICRKYCEKYPFFKLVVNEKNIGVSASRNLGLDMAQGKYIVFLDSDDRLTENALKKLADFFDKHEKEVDIITYKIVPVYEGKPIGALHYRYQFLTHEGVYDVSRPENIFISQTTMNICVKNYDGVEKIRFDTNLAFHEDEKYNIDVISKKMKIGYCEGAQYLYTKNPGSVTKTYSYAYYIFEPTTAFWENLFASYNGNVPQYIQALYVNDLNWKGKSDILLPYHYDDESFGVVKKRLCDLLNRVDDEVILNHPQVENPHKFFMLELKDRESLEVKSGYKGVAIMKNDIPLFYDRALPLSLCRFKVNDSFAYIDAFLRSPIFSLCEKPEAFIHLVNDSGTKIVKAELEASAWDYYHAKIKTNKFWRLRFEWDYKKYPVIFFASKIDGKEVPVRLESMIPTAPFNAAVNRKVLFRCSHEFEIEENGFVSRRSSAAKEKSSLTTYQHYLLPRKPRTFAWRQYCMKTVLSGRRIWLYCDCRNVLKDNGYYQFIHDFDMDDGVERYYVVNDNIDRKALFTPKQRRHIIKFGSLKHRKYFLAAEKVITAFAEFTNINPFPVGVWKYYTDIFKAEVVYLQHGVLHAFLPWKYANDRLTLIDREVISTTFERSNMSENYGFRAKDLIPAGMPRYDFIDAEKVVSEKKVLFAPTWRKYLVQYNSDGSFSPAFDKFEKSIFFKETYAFLHSKELEKYLEENDWYLDFKLHPIFSEYASLYNLNGGRIRIADRAVDEKTYKVFITDFSSFCFDFVYLKKTIMYFIPDEELFKAGLNDYRKLDLPHEKGFGPASYDANSAIEQLCGIIGRGGEPEKLYSERMDGFFIHYDDKCRDRIYEALTENGEKNDRNSAH